MLRVEIDTRGGNVVAADLLAYPQEPKDFAHPVRLLDSSASHYFEAQSGLVSAQGIAPDHTATFTAEKNEYALADGADTIEVPLTWTDASGLQVRKVFVFKRASYAIEQRQEITNKTNAPWNGNAYRQLQRVPPVIDTHGIKAYSNTERYSFIGAAYYNASDKFQKIKFDNFAKEPLDKTLRRRLGSDAAALFLRGVDSERGRDRSLRDRGRAGRRRPRYLIRTESPAISVAPGETKTDTARLYVGPKLQSTLDQVAPGLSLTADYGIFTVISEPLHWILAQLHKLTGNWGFAIILLVAADQGRVLQAVRSAVPLDGAHAQDAAAHRSAEGALRRRSPEDEPGDAGAVPKGKNQPARRLPADAGADSGVLRAVLGAARKRRVAPGAVHPAGSRTSPRPIRTSCCRS